MESPASRAAHAQSPRITSPRPVHVSSRRPTDGFFETSRALRPPPPPPPRLLAPPMLRQNTVWAAELDELDAAVVAEAAAVLRAQENSYTPHLNHVRVSAGSLAEICVIDAVLRVDSSYSHAAVENDVLLSAVYEAATSEQHTRISAHEKVSLDSDCAAAERQAAERVMGATAGVKPMKADEDIAGTSTIVLGENHCIAADLSRPPQEAEPIAVRVYVPPTELAPADAASSPTHAAPSHSHIESTSGHAASNHVHEAPADAPPSPSRSASSPWYEADREVNNGSPLPAKSLAHAASASSSTHQVPGSPSHNEPIFEQAASISADEAASVHDDDMSPANTISLESAAPKPGSESNLLYAASHQSHAESSSLQAASSLSYEAANVQNDDVLPATVTSPADTAPSPTHELPATSMSPAVAQPLLHAAADPVCEAASLHVVSLSAPAISLADVTPTPAHAEPSPSEPELTSAQALLNINYDASNVDDNDKELPAPVTFPAGAAMSPAHVASSPPNSARSPTHAESSPARAESIPSAQVASSPAVEAASMEDADASSTTAMSPAWCDAKSNSR